MPKRERGNSFDNRAFGSKNLPVRKARSFVIPTKVNESNICPNVKSKSIIEREDERKLRDSAGAPDRGRKNLQTVNYDPFQIEAYQSKYSRYIKALNIAPSSTVKNGDVTLYAFQSCDSPTGFWQVTRTETDKQLWFLGGQCSAVYTMIITVYRIGVGNNGTTAGVTYSTTTSRLVTGPIGNPYFGASLSVPGQEALLLPTGTGVIEFFGPWAKDTYSSYYFTVDGVSLGSNTSTLTEDGFFLLKEDGSRLLLESQDIGQTTKLLTEDGFYLLQEDGFYLLSENLDSGGITSDSCGNGPSASLPSNAYLRAQCPIWYEVTVTECFTGITNACVTSIKRVKGPLGGIYFTRNPPIIGSPFMAWFMQAPDYPNNGGLQITGAYNSNFYTSLTVSIDKVEVSPPPTNPAGTQDSCGFSKYVPPITIKESAWACTCPDKTKKIDADIRSTFDSRRFNRDWSSSNAGATGDCKHIYAAKIAAGVTFEVPKDVPAKLSSVTPRTAALDPFGKWAR